MVILRIASAAATRNFSLSSWSSGVNDVAASLASDFRSPRATTAPMHGPVLVLQRPDQASQHAVAGNADAVTCAAQRRTSASGSRMPAPMPSGTPSLSV